MAISDFNHGGGCADYEQGMFKLPADLSLHFGGTLHDVQIAWRLEGVAKAPVVLVLGGISAGRNVVAQTDSSRESGTPQGWWKEVMGPGRALDTLHYRVLGIDFLGGSGWSPGPNDRNGPGGHDGRRRTGEQRPSRDGGSRRSRSLRRR